jgi:hypothetical protein
VPDLDLGMQQTGVPRGPLTPDAMLPRKPKRGTRLAHISGVPLCPLDSRPTHRVFANMRALLTNTTFSIWCTGEKTARRPTPSCRPMEEQGSLQHVAKGRNTRAMPAMGRHGQPSQREGHRPGNVLCGP